VPRATAGSQPTLLITIDGKPYDLDRDSGSEADESDAFQSVETVEDLGLRRWHRANLDGGAVDAQFDSPSFDSISSLTEVLRKLMHDSLAKSEVSNAKFLPLSDLYAIINDKVIRQLAAFLQPSHGSTTSASDFATAICGYDNRTSRPKTMRKLLAILILAGKPSSILKFVEYGRVSDGELPLSLDKETRQISLRYRTRRDGHPRRFPNPFEEWSSEEIQSFETNQNLFLAPFFELGHGQFCFYKLADASPLPFLSYEATSDQTRKISIHPAHHNFQGLEVTYKLNSHGRY